ncbi:DUF58 domain-containing protein [Microbacterium sp.]|uniref:DUF58 domain-containing protein n=1 Tax=Microbacterium sp. TaxID=51671 RepID=UPI003A88FE56
MTAVHDTDQPASVTPRDEPARPEPAAPLHEQPPQDRPRRDRPFSGPTRAADTAAADDARRERRERRAAWLLRVASRLRSVAGVIRPLGWVVIAVAAVLWAVALWLGWQEMMIAAAVVTTVIAVCLFFLIGRTTYDVELDLTRSRVVVGERAIGGLTLRNDTARAILPSEVVLPVGSGRGIFAVPRLAVGEEHEELFAIPTRARGVLAVGPVSVLRGDPIGLFERTHNRRAATDLYVHPRTTDLSGLSLGRMRDLEGLPVRQLERDDVSFHALREYQPGDDLRHVHWKSTARIGRLMVRQYEQTRRSHFVIGLSTNADEYGAPDEFELAISIAGSVGLRALSDARVLDARVPQGALRTRSPRALLDELSGLGQSRPRAGTIADLAGAAAAHSPQAAIAVLITGSRADPGRLRAACSRLPRDVRVLAVVAEDGRSAPELRRIGDADLVALGALDQLPRAVRRVLA